MRRGGWVCIYSVGGYRCLEGTEVSVRGYGCLWGCVGVYRGYGCL